MQIKVSIEDVFEAAKRVLPPVNDDTNIYRLCSFKRFYTVLEENKISLSSPIIFVLLNKGLACSSCGKAALSAFLRKEDSGQPSYHVAVYVDKQPAQKARMTVDHTTPRSAGGENLLKNLQPMCYACNNAKGATLIGA
jgi:hypothetical protein